MKSSTLGRLIFLNFAQLAMINAIAIGFYYFFTLFIKRAIFNLIKVFSFQGDGFSRPHYETMVSLDSVELITYSVIFIITLSFTSLLVTYLTSAPFFTAYEKLNNHLSEQNESKLKIKPLLKNTKVVYISNLFIDFLNGNQENAQKILDQKKLVHFKPLQFRSLYVLTLIPNIITFIVIMFHSSFTYNMKTTSVVTAQMDANNVIASNIDHFGDLMFLISSLTVLIYLIFLFVYSKYTIKNYIGASYSFVKTVLGYTQGELNSSFYFRNQDPSLPVLASLKNLEDKIIKKIDGKS